MDSSRSILLDCGNPIEWDHPLNEGLLAHFLCHPQFAGGAKLHDLCRPGDLSRAGTLAGMAAPYLSTTSGWQRGGNRPGSFGAGLAFDGTNDHVSCGPPPVDYSTSPWSAACWFRFNSTPTAAAALSYGNGGVSTFRYWQLGSNGSSQLSFGAYNGTNQSTTGATLSTNIWYYIGVSYLSGTATLYLTGVQSGAGGAVSVGTRTDAENLTRIGFPGFTSLSSYLNGQVDDVRIYSRAIGPMFAALYQSSLTQYPGVLRRPSTRTYFLPSSATPGGPWPWHLDNSLAGGMYTGSGV